MELMLISLTNFKITHYHVQQYTLVFLPLLFIRDE